jgi:hypothetical protein
MKLICSVVFAVFIAVLAWAEVPVVLTPTEGPYAVVAVANADADFALARLDLAAPFLVLKEKVRDLDSAAKLLHRSLSYAHRMRVGQCGEWIFFPRIDIASDDSTFKSGCAIKLGTSEVFHWKEVQK